MLNLFKLFFAQIIVFSIGATFASSKSDAGNLPQLAQINEPLENARNEDQLYLRYLHAIAHNETEQLEAFQNTADENLFMQAADELSHSVNPVKIGYIRMIFGSSMSLHFIDSADELLSYAIYLRAHGRTDLEREQRLLLLKISDLNSSEKFNNASEIISEYSKSWPVDKRDKKVVTKDRTALAKDLLFVEPDVAHYHSGLFVGKPRVYMLCRQDRTYPCLMVIKNHLGAWQHTANGEVWSQPSLGYSRHHETFDHPNGNTPSGVIRMDGIMPAEKKTWSFGKFRRVILNLVEASEGEREVLKLLPPSSIDDTWWREAVTARNIGRGLFRIHGTGMWTTPGANFYPFAPTSGCIAKRENNHSGVEYVDQKLFLDELMRAMGLEPKPENIDHIRGLLYVINIDAQTKPVGPEDILKLGLK